MAGRNRSPRSIFTRRPITRQSIFLATSSGSSCCRPMKRRPRSTCNWPMAPAESRSNGGCAGWWSSRLTLKWRRISIRSRNLSTSAAERCAPPTDLGHRSLQRSQRGQGELVRHPCPKRASFGARSTGNFGQKPNRLWPVLETRESISKSNRKCLARILNTAAYLAAANCNIRKSHFPVPPMQASVAGGLTSRLGSSAPWG